MKKLLILICCSVLFVVCLSGCTKKPQYAVLSKDSMKTLDASKVTEVFLLSPTDSGKNFEHVENWVSVKKKIFPITEPNKISTIVNCIRDGCLTASKMKILQLEIHVLFVSGLDPDSKRDLITNIFTLYEPNQINFLMNYLKDQNVTPMLLPENILRSTWIFFETEKINYGTIILWSDDSVYGEWWESPELLNIFKGWELEERPKIDPNKLLPVRIKNPPREMDPNSHRLRNGAYSRGRDINEVDDESKDANAPAVER